MGDSEAIMQRWFDDTSDQPIKVALRRDPQRTGVVDYINVSGPDQRRYMANVKWHEFGHPDSMHRLGELRLAEGD